MIQLQSEKATAHCQYWSMYFLRNRDGVVEDGSLEDEDYWEFSWIKSLNGLSDDDSVSDEDIDEIIQQICYCLISGEKYCIYEEGSLIVCDRQNLYEHLVNTCGEEFAEDRGVDCTIFSREYLSRHSDLIEVTYTNFHVLWHGRE